MIATRLELRDESGGDLEAPQGPENGSGGEESPQRRPADPQEAPTDGLEQQHAFCDRPAAKDRGEHETQEEYSSNPDHRSQQVEGDDGQIGHRDCPFPVGHFAASIICGFRAFSKITARLGAPRGFSGSGFS